MNLVPGKFPRQSGYLIKDKLFTPAVRLRLKFILAYKHQLWKKVLLSRPGLFAIKMTKMLIRRNTSLIPESL
jgi:hypothetical protein